MIIRTKSLSTSRVLIDRARVDVLKRLYEECLAEVPDADTVTVTVRAFDRDADTITVTVPAFDRDADEGSLK